MTNPDLADWERMRHNTPSPYSALAAVMLRRRLGARQSMEGAFVAAQRRRVTASRQVQRVESLAEEHPGAVRSDVG